MPLGDILQIRIECSMGDQASENIRHIQIMSVTAPEPPYSAIADQLSTGLSAKYIPAIATNARYNGVAVRRVKPLPPTIETISLIGANPGTATGDAMPGQVAGLGNLKSAFAGRAFRGRVYVPFPAESDNGPDGAPTAAYLVKLQALIDLLVAGGTITLGGGNLTFNWVLYHRVAGTTTPLTVATARPKFATQRRRGGFGRPNPATIV